MEARGPFAVQQDSSRRRATSAVSNTSISRNGQKANSGVASIVPFGDHSKKQNAQQEVFREPEVGTFRADSFSFDKTNNPLQCNNSEKEIFDEVSSLVEELQAVRNSTLAAGGKPSRAVEAAASALEPLLKLRNVTGAAAAGDLRQLPWLPQLLSIFRNVLHTAADSGSGGHWSSAPTPRNQNSLPTSPDHGAGGIATPRCTTPRKPKNAYGDNAAAAMAAAAAAALGALSDANVGRKDSSPQRQQHQQHQQQRQREKDLIRELRETRRERDELADRVAQLEAMISTDFNGDAAVQYLTRRVSELERGESSWRQERRSAEDLVENLLDMAGDALEDKSNFRGSPPEAAALMDANPYTRVRKVMR
jgi:hypothetical protein